ncbi:hypothetical protein DFH07DRAFT_784561 [Mycena maculata]|uniref:3'-5' exonuclease domain-containing protein n=1 Tax=Mycena maculata TaxID=230809 RepID=A0AAD7HG58_9AGAR|nr:hypothetical protein DFH07DRAFT_784561 [Mycena maculata]
MMWLMCNTFATRFGPSPFSEMVSEVQHRYHADAELMYLAAVIFYGQRGRKQFSKFDDRQGYAGSPPSVGYLKGLFTDFVTAHRIYIERYISSLPLTIAKADHTFQFLKYIAGLKGEQIFNAAYNILNEFEECRGHSLTQTKSLLFVQDLWERIQEGFVHGFATSSLTKNVVPVTEWTDLPLLTRSLAAPVTIASNSMDIEAAANALLEDLVNIPSSSSRFNVVALTIKTEQRAGELHLDIMQLQTVDHVCVFKVTDLTSRSDMLPSLRAILTNPTIIKIGHSIHQTLQTISQALSQPEIDTVLKTRSPPLLDLGKYAKLKGVLNDPSVSLTALAGVVLKRSFAAPQFLPYPWSGNMSSQQNEFLFSEIDCIWQVYVSLSERNSVGLPLQPTQATTHGQLVTLVQGCKPIAEGSIVAPHSGFLNAVMDDQAHTYLALAFFDPNFEVPTPPTPSDDDTNFSTTYVSSNTINFEHWNGGTNDPDDDSDGSDDDSESEDDIYSRRLVFETSSDDVMQGVETDPLGSYGDENDFRTGGKTYPPHERWKNVDFDKFAQWWNAQVNFQPRTITESNLRLYYKLPQHLEAHHKKTISWSSERSTLAAGANFAARKEFLEILNSEDNLGDVLPAILFAAVPDGEQDVSLSSFSVPMSFDLVTARPEESEQPGLESQLLELEQHQEVDCDIAIPFGPDELPPPLDPDEDFAAPGPLQSTTPALHQQLLLPGASVPAPSTSKSPKRPDRKWETVFKSGQIAAVKLYQWLCSGRARQRRFALI